MNRLEITVRRFDMNHSKLQTTNILGITLIATILECGPHWVGNEFIDSYFIQFDNGETMTISTDRVGKDFLPLTDNSTPIVSAVSSHSFVLADLFDVESLEQDVPKHVIENDPAFDYVTCPCCDGEKWVEVEGNVWTKALFSDPRRAYAYRHLNYSSKPCGRCGASGEVLEPSTPPLPQHDDYGEHTLTVDKLIARVEYLLAQRRAGRETTIKNHRAISLQSEPLQLAA
jgi:hypothetical protein